MNIFPFTLPADGWYQICALGEFAHNPTGFTQIMDESACRAIVQQFQQEATAPNFPGVLVDFDHFSLEQDKPSAAAGWISALDYRPGSGLWAQIRWSDAGLDAVRGGRYRFISPVWRQDECEALGNARIRPRHLCNAALTNDPNISGMVPLSNSRRRIAARFRGCASPLSRRAFPIRNRTPFSAMTQQQRKAMFARMGEGGGGATDDVTSARSRYQEDQTSLDDYENDLRAGGHLDEPTIKKLRDEKDAAQQQAHYEQDQTDLEDYRRDLEAHGSLDAATINKLVAEKEKRQEEEGMSAWDQRINDRIARQVAEDKQRKAAEQGSQPEPPTATPDPSGTETPATPAPKPYQYDLDRARTSLSALEAQAASVANGPNPAQPTARVFDQVDLHKMRWDLIQKGVDPTEADRQVEEQRQVNDQRAADLRAIKSQINKKYKTNAQRKNALAKELNRISAANDRAVTTFQKNVQTKTNKTGALSSRIAAEKARIETITQLQGG